MHKFLMSTVKSSNLETLTEVFDQVLHQNFQLNESIKIYKCCWEFSGNIKKDNLYVIKSREHVKNFLSSHCLNY